MSIPQGDMVEHEDHDWSIPDLPADLGGIYNDLFEYFGPATVPGGSVGDSINPNTINAPTAHDTLLAVPDVDMSTMLSLVPDAGYRPSSQTKRSISETEYVQPARDQLDVEPILSTIPESTASTPLQLSKTLQDELTVLYFRHVHPLCPVVDEYHFMGLYSQSSSVDALYESFNPMLYQAMLFMAFSHLNASTLARTPFRTIPQGQQALMAPVKDLYEQYTGDDHTMLTQVCLLLSYWSPYNEDPHVNSYWVSRAFYHARAARLWDPNSDSCTMSSRRKITWWSCLIRDRLIGFGLRRLHLLHDRESTWPMVTPQDFGAEAFAPRIMELRCKRAMIGTFISLCKLSKLIVEVGSFHMKTVFGHEWRTEGEHLESSMTEIYQVASYESRLLQWNDDFERETRPVMEREYPGMSKVPIYTLQIYNASLTASLYRPYLRKSASRDSVEARFRALAVLKIKEASTRVAKILYNLISKVSTDNIPLAIFAWILLPMAICTVDWHSTEDTSVALNFQQRSEIMAALDRISERFNGAKVAFELVRSTKALLDQKGQSEIRGGGSKRARTRASESPKTSEQGMEDEADTLEMVAGMIDLTLAHDGGPMTQPPARL